MVKKHGASSPLSRLFHSLFAVVILAAFVLSLSFFIQKASSVDTGKVLARLGIPDYLLGDVAGMFTKRLDIVGDSQETTPSVATANEKPDILSETSTSVVKDTNKLSFKVALMADSHEDTELLAQALTESKGEDVAAVFELGDLTNLGVIDALEASKKVLDASGLDYYVLPGDHDLWKSVGPGNFIEVFGKNYRSVKIDGYKFVMLDNSANYTLISDVEMAWFKAELKDADFVLLSQPIYHPKNSIVMGVVKGEEVPDVLAQSKQILDLIQKSNVMAVIAADQHMSSQSVDPVRDSLSHIVVGAITKTHDGIINLQTPKYAMLSVYEDGSYKVDDVQLDL